MKKYTQNILFSVGFVHISSWSLPWIDVLRGVILAIHLTSTGN